MSGLRRIACDDRSLDTDGLDRGGPVGLGMAKALLEHKILYEELEADDDLGGNWFHGVYETVHIISSRKTTASYWKTLAKILEDPSATNN